ncbi:uncharacterized protein LOC130448552 [Diorhabda sublineata]|uniref:uncharacterized protein LOC130448552 n=1 Tax=Diorhabda sublineata TaxID=1163346 RepID=UPI0024E080ED|nr:uncharacterized protein LOC130448552 [Diorhabda sublineata]
MLEYQSTQTNEDFSNRSTNLSSQEEAKPSLTKIWEIIVRTKRLPDGVSEALLYESIRDKLRDPEKEVRQHVLRVLMDLIQVTQSSNLDKRMQELVPDIIKILGHSSPSLRKTALDFLKKYLKLSGNYYEIMRDLIDSPDYLMSATPFLINSETDDKTVSLVLEQLWKDLERSNINQEIPAKSLARLRYNLGDERFKYLIGLERYRKLQEICEIYGLPIDYSDTDIMISENDNWSHDEALEDKVILETEITLKTGPAITMKIHEESRPNSGVGNPGEIEVKSKFEAARRTPRKVRFGGEHVKLRTPESDSSNQDEPKNTLRITVTDAVAITTKKSLIPIRITSLPTTPLKRSQNITKNRLHQSAPNLSRNFETSRIPFSRESNLKEKFNIPQKILKDKPQMKLKSRSSDNLDISKTVIPISSVRTINNVSPLPPHKEIEVLHNLTRSPAKKRRPSTVDVSVTSTEANTSFNSFKICPMSSGEVSCDTTTESEKNYDSFKICPISEEQPPEDLRISLFNANSLSTSTYSSDKSSSQDIVDGTQPLGYNSVRALEYISPDKGYNSFTVYPHNLNHEKKKTVPEEIMPQDVNENLDFNRQWKLSSLSSEDSFGNKSEALDNLVKMLKQPGTCESLEAGPAALLFEALFACQYLDKLHFLADAALGLMIKNIRAEILERCLGRVSLEICKIGAPSGVYLALMIMNKCSPKRFLQEIMDRCFAHKTREGALQVLMASSRLLPRTDLEIIKMAEFAAATLRDKRRKVRHAALETLATLAQLSSNGEVLGVVERVTKAVPDHQYLLRVVRTRLSRRQLPTVELNGTVRYSTPKDPSEVEWLSGSISNDNHSVSSSASSSNNSVNYWRRNSRHDVDEKRIGSAQSSIKLFFTHASCLKFTPASYSHFDMLLCRLFALRPVSLNNFVVDESANGNQQIWAVDSSVFPRNGRVKDNITKGNSSILRPVYILQPEAVTENVRGYRRYDRGRSFSPPKPNQKQAAHPVPASTTLQNIVPSQNNFSYREGVRKSFSSEQLFVRERENHEPYSYSLSSRSSSTSTGSSTKSGIWHKEMRSGIPVPITSETKFRLRTNASSNNVTGPVVARRLLIEYNVEIKMCNNNVLTNPWGLRESPPLGKVIAKCCPCFFTKISDIHVSGAKEVSTPVLTITLPPKSLSEKSALGSVPDTPIIARSSPRESPEKQNTIQVVQPPPLSSGSESSGYDTPPPESNKAFVKLDSVDKTSESGREDDENDTNNTIQESKDDVDSTQEISTINVSPSRTETTQVIEESIQRNADSSPSATEIFVKEDPVVRRFSISHSNEPSFIEKTSPIAGKKVKSKSVIDLPSFLPEISPSRKNINSAPLLKEDIISNGNIVISTYEEIHTVIPISTIQGDANQNTESPPKEITITRKLSRRLSRTQSRRSIKSTPRNDSPNSSRSRGNKSKDTTLQLSLNQLNNPEWEVMIQGLKSLTHIAKYYPEVIEGQMHTVCVNLAKHIKNLRSQVARAACHTAAELFGSCKRNLDMELEEIAGPLLHRTADTNKFLRADANAALDVMCKNLPINRTITVIISRGCNHQNSIVRAAAIRLMTDLVKRHGADKIFQMNKEIRDKIIVAGANSLTDGSLEARSHGKEMFSHLIGHSQFQKSLLEAVPQNTLRHIAKTLNSIKASGT